MTPPIILFTYDGSVFGRKMDWVFALKGLKYFHCPVLHRLPRPVLEKLGVQYRRIPILAIGRDIYCDTRLIIDKVEELFPESSIGSKNPFEKGLEHVLENWLVDGGPFARTAGIIPPNSAFMQEKEWVEDRKAMSGRSFDTESIKRGRPESLAHVRMYFNQMENELLDDGREYILNTKEPTLADIHCIWTFDWALQTTGRMYENLEKETISAEHYPRTFAYVDRFRKAIAIRQEQVGKPTGLSSEETFKEILNSDFFEAEGSIDPRDPLKLRKGQVVEIFPVDSGFTHHDRGELVSIGVKEVVILSKTNAGEGKLRVHYPRVNIRIQPIEEFKL